MVYFLASEFWLYLKDLKGCVMALLERWLRVLLLVLDRLGVMALLEMGFH